MFVCVGLVPLCYLVADILFFYVCFEGEVEGVVVPMYSGFCYTVLRGGYVTGDCL